MSMTSLLAQEEGRTFVEAAEAASNTATQHFYHPEPKQSMPSPKPVQTLVFRAAQLRGTYFKCEDEDERVTRVSQLDAFQHLPDFSLGTSGNNNDNDARGGPLAFVIRRKRERRKKPAMEATKKLFPSLSKGMVVRSNNLKKGHICLKATKARSAQELVKQIDPGYEKIEEADLFNTLDWLVAPVHRCLGCYNTNWFMGIYMQLMANHCPEWADVEPTCATNFAFMEFPIFARDTEDMDEVSAAGPDIQLAQSWESPSTINSKATWDSQSHEHLRFANSHPPKDLEKILLFSF
eukprot:jgi/Psemu1/49854/gm1.49854_g